MSQDLLFVLSEIRQAFNEIKTHEKHGQISPKEAEDQLKYVRILDISVLKYMQKQSEEKLAAQGL